MFSNPYIVKDEAISWKSCAHCAKSQSYFGNHLTGIWNQICESRQKLFVVKRTKKILPARKLPHFVRLLFETNFRCICENRKRKTEQGCNIVYSMTDKRISIYLLECLLNTIAELNICFCLEILDLQFLDNFKFISIGSLNYNLKSNLCCHFRFAYILSLFFVSPII